MVRPRKVLPEKRAHISGQDRVYLDGRYYYLGQSGSAEAQARYDTLVSKYLSNGRKMPDDEPTHQAEREITVGNIAAEYERLIDARPTLEDHRHLCVLLVDTFGDVPASEFGPRRLSELRDLLVATGIARPTINRQIRQITLMFRHAVSRELIDYRLFERLTTLEPLRIGQTSAPEYKQRKPANMQDVAAAAKLLSPTIRAMLTIQVATGMRPSEIFAMRPRDIDRSGSEWFYRPEHHKTAKHGVIKAIPIVGTAREALTPFLIRPADAYCFSPAESAQWHRDQRTAKRTTPSRQGNCVGAVRKENPKRAPGECFDKNGLNLAVRRACIKAKVTRWTPYQLRHNAATAIADAMGMDGARALLGHTGEAMTRRYVHQKQDEAKAIEAARHIAGAGV